MGRKDPGTFQWNAGGWFGSQVGSTLWIAIVGMIHISIDARVALFAVSFFVWANVIGLFMWRQRTKLPPFPAIQLLLVVIGLASAGTLIVLDLFGRLAAFDPRFGPGVPRSIYVLLLLFPGLMLRFYMMERRARGR